MNPAHILVPTLAPLSGFTYCATCGHRDFRHNGNWCGGCAEKKRGLL